MRLTALILAGTLAMPLPAKGQNQGQTIIGGPLTTRLLQEWDLAVRLEGALTPDLIETYRRHVAPPQPPVAFAHSHPPRRSWSGTVEQWRPLVEAYFPPEAVEWAMRVMACESGGNPYAKNPNSSASGLFQHLARYWPDRSTRAGWAGADIFDPTANVAVAAWLYSWGGPGHWVCK